MSQRRRARVLVAVVGLAVGSHAAEKPAAHDVQVRQDSKTMEMNEPMTTEMMKKGMKKGDVKREADKKAREMQPRMEQEENSMPDRKPTP